MKKIFTFVLLTMALLVTDRVNAQLNFGIKGGLNVTSMSLDSKVFDTSNRTGWYIGPTVKFTLPLVGLGVDASALYDMKTTGISDSNTDSEKTIKDQQITIPVNLRYSIGLGSSANVFLYAGPQWGINIGDKNFKWNETDSYSLKKSNFSVNIGAGVTVLSHLQINANYNIACGKSADLSLWDAATNAYKNESSNNNYWQIGAAYFF